jgi:UDPglucose 6-dehydrogenase
MKIGIVGAGVVGDAISRGLKLLNHDIYIHDLKFNTRIDIVKNTDIVFICVPSPNNENGHCDTSIIESVIVELNDINYKGIVAIKTTVVPGFTQNMIVKFGNLNLCFVPEFLRERCAFDDFVNNYSLLAVGTHDKWIFHKMIEAHGSYPKETVMMTPNEAEILKYYSNSLAALRITFSNIFYELCQKLGGDYTKIKDAYVLTKKINDLYLDVNTNLRGFGGTCLPKDTEALVALLNDLNLEFSLIEAIVTDNKKFDTTVFNGMRLK